MLDIKFIRDHADLVKKGTADKQRDPKLVDQVLELDDKRRVLISQTEQLRSVRNKLTKEQIEEGKKIKDQLKLTEPELKSLEEQLVAVLGRIPNPPAPDVKVGKNESENEVIRKWGEPRKFDFKPRDHVDLGVALGIIDIDRAAKVSGTRFDYLKGDAVLLEFALVDLAFKTLIKEGFTPIIPPVLIKTESMAGMGYLEYGGAENMYLLNEDGLILVGTSEQAIGPMHKDETLDGKILPLRYVGFSSCFRREAGSYGQDTRGILRVHQFDKVEMFSFTKPENSDKEHEYFLGLEEKLMQILEIPYQVVKMCTGDIGDPFVRKYDLEAWLPGQNRYREVTSTSNATDFQARRLNIKFKDGAKTEFVHMLNGTAFSGRPIIAILENYQNADGSVTIPRVLRSYIGKDTITPAHS